MPASDQWIAWVIIGTCFGVGLAVAEGIVALVKFLVSFIGTASKKKKD